MGTRIRIGIIGGGPAGYVAAIRGAQLGAEVTVFERERLGGVCTNHGCIPTKTLYALAAVKNEAENLGNRGLWECTISHDWRRIIGYKDGVVSRLVKGIEFLLRKRAVKIVNSEAYLESPEVVKTVDGHSFQFDRILIATGSEAALPPIDGLSGIAPWDNRKALATERLPESLVIVGGGVIGVEFAHIFASFGVKVKIVEIMPRILPTIDDEISSLVHRALVGEGVEIMTSAKAVSAERAADRVRLKLESGEVVEGEEIIVATGRKVTPPHGTQEVGINFEKNKISVNEYLMTNIDGIYAAGDIVGEPYLEHKATHQGITAVENMLGANRRWDGSVMPTAIFSALEVGIVGLTPKEAEERFGNNIKVGKFPYVASGRAQTEGKANGFVRLVAAPDDKIVGFQAVGHHAAELLGIGTTLVKLGTPLSKVAETIFAHPTLSEMICEAALAGLRKPIHIV